MKNTTTRSSLVLLFFLIINLSLAQEQSLRDIYGIITFEEKPIENVNITIKGSQKGTKTDANGNYRLTTKVGDVVVFSHVSFETIAIVVEDITSELTFELSEKGNQLKEAVVTVKKPVRSAISISDKLHQEINTAVGKLNPMALPSRTNYIEGRSIGSQYFTIRDFLQGRFAGNYPNMVFDVDGLVYAEEPPINISDIIDLYLIRGSAGTMRWCSQFGFKTGCSVVIVRTLNSPEEVAARKEAIAEKYRNQNYYQDDAVAINKNEEETQSLEIQQKEIFGKITTNDAPLKDVNIRILGSAKGTTSDSKGNYRLSVSIGDEIEYSYVGMHKVGVIIEDITSEVNIDMVSLKNSLDEVLVIAKNSKGEVIKRSKKAESTFKTSRGTFDPKRVGYSVGYIDGQQVNFALYNSLREALIGKVSGLSVNLSTGKVYMRGQNSSISGDYPVAWEVDGNFTSNEPVGINLNEIKDIRLLRGLASTNKYGTLGAGGVIVVTTTMGDLSGNNKISGIREEFTNQNYYQNDAVSLEDNIVSGNHVNALKEYNNRALAYKFYEDQMAEALPSYQYHIDIAQTFNRYFKDSFRAAEVLMNVAKNNHRNPEILKAVAFNLQGINARRQAVTVYQQILSLRPTYGQSYRDLANAYKDNNQFKKSWRFYMNYLLRGNNLEGEGIGQLIYNEMEYLYFNRANQTQIEQQFTPKSKDKVEFRDDVRFVVEWNTSEAEFNLEFVGPDKRAYTFEHTLVANQELITDEKKTGYSSKEFIIDAIGTGEWLVNITYFGNKKTAPTYFKLTTYYNWGSPHQREEISVYRLDMEDQKFQLLKLNKEVLVTQK